MIVTNIFLNRKYEEIYPPDVGEFVYITDDTYSKMHVIKMENLLLRVLSFDLTVPTHYTFLMEYCITNNLSDRVRYLAMVMTLYKVYSIFVTCVYVVVHKLQKRNLFQCMQQKIYIISPI